ncbi:MAG: transporter substrate-binding domain-containing protein [Clostridia bacterium]|nr:transporter substrate-binding domain-containing protein [Clostridia bacterium]
MKKKVLIALLIVAIVSVSVMALAGCNDKGVKVGFQTGTTGQSYTEEYKNLTGVQYQNATNAVQDMVNGRIKYVITDIAPAKAIASQANFSGKVKVIDIALTDEIYCFAVNKDNDALKAQLNEFMINNSEELKSLQEAYIAGTNDVKKIPKGNKNAENALIVATNAEFAPFEYMIGEDFAGYDMEVMQMFCKEYGYELVIENMDFDAVVSSVNLKKADIGAAALTFDEDRAKLVNFTDKYYESTQVIICMADDTTFDDCKTREDVEKILNSLS